MRSFVKNDWCLGKPSVLAGEILYTYYWKTKGKKIFFSLSILPKNYKYCWSEANEHEKEEKRMQEKENFISFLQD